MINPPLYFSKVRDGAARRWDQLEGDPELAAPWHQLFKQVQSPRHIVSELLQNADDAEATEATVSVRNKKFAFAHNGGDFTEEHFASLCRFGYSNKRALHTIGFRGIGFKSIFSLGDKVDLRTPTLSVTFERRRFTEPKWITSTEPPTSLTDVLVNIADPHRELELKKNLEEWLKSPVSLLFFRHLRRLRIQDQEMFWGSLGPGPVVGSEWMALNGDPNRAFLLARSHEEPFPEEALSEIRQERLLNTDDETNFPACKVEIVLNAKGRLYVVLPTGVHTNLPFACNGPFIQDPARLKIKDPETSPTNRWLLDRAGTLAASVMLQWLGKADASMVERAGAYGLLPDVDRDDESLEGVCAAQVELAFEEAIQEQELLLTATGEIKREGQCIVVPDELFDVWSSKELSELFDDDHRQVLCREVAPADRDKLGNWGLLDVIDKDDILLVIQNKRLPKPSTWRQLLKLWAYLAPELVGWKTYATRSRMRLLPAQGKEVLYSASEVARLGEKRLLQADEDWEFLSAHLLVLNQNWLRFIAEQRRTKDEVAPQAAEKDAASATDVLNALGLQETSDTSKVIDRVAADFFSTGKVALSDCVRLAQIAAKLGVTVGDAFRFATEDLHLRARTHSVVFDRIGALSDLLPEDWRSEHVLHSDYTKEFSSCTADEWANWTTSGRSGLQGFVPLVQTRSRFWDRKDITAELRRRGGKSEPNYPYKLDSFAIVDWDFDYRLWNHWGELAKNDDQLWGKVAECLFAQPPSYWTNALQANAVQIATTSSEKSITADPLLPSWILKLRNLACLPDTRGFLRRPRDLLRRTRETEALIDVEYFIDSTFDQEATRKLLHLLGVRGTPTSPRRLVDRIRALARAPQPPISELEKWYRRLDQLIDTCATADLAEIKATFRTERVILSEGGEWCQSDAIFLGANEEDVPGAAVVRASVRDLTLWRKLGVEERPTADLAIAWLSQLPAGEALSQEDFRRVRVLMSRHAFRIWNECGHWVNLLREWVPVASLEYSITMATLTEHRHLHESVKQKVADLTQLTSEVADSLPFRGLPRLSTLIEERFELDLFGAGAPEKLAWLDKLGTELVRIKLDSDEETQRVRLLAKSLLGAECVVVPKLEVVPYIKGSPAGTPKRVDVCWKDQTIYAEPLPKAKLARVVPLRLARVFGRQDITDALNYCFGRSPRDVSEYMEENFELEVQTSSVPAPPQEGKSQATEAAGASTGQCTPTGHAIDEEDAPPEGGLPEIDLAGLLGKGTADSEPPTVRRQARPAKPSIMERFAFARGYVKESDDRFVHKNGNHLARLSGEVFSWEMRDMAGELICQYLPKEHCLETQPLELDAEVWALMERRPKYYALLLVSHEGEPSVHSASDLLAYRDEGSLKIYPASYRLVLHHEYSNQN